MSVVASLLAPARRNSDEMLLGPVFFTTTRKPAVLPALTPSADRFVEVIDQPFGGAARAPSGPISAAASDATANAAVRRVACVRFKGVLQVNGLSSRGGACTIDDPNRYSSLTEYRRGADYARAGKCSPNTMRSISMSDAMTITPILVADLLAEGERMPVYVHVIDHPYGRVLVDTGMTELHPLVADMDPQLRPLGEQ